MSHEERSSGDFRNRPDGGGAGAGSRRVWLGTVLACACITQLGCSGGDTIPTYPVSGRVLVGGEPAAGAFVVFHPTGEAVPDQVRPTAQVQADGSFALATNDAADGAPAGEYAVTIEWYKLVQKGGEAQAGPNVVPPPYARPESTPIKVTIVENDNPLPPFQIVRK
jgi:hypothetical protein